MTKRTAPATNPIRTIGELSESDRLTITVEEACALLGVDRRTVYKAMDAGELPEVRLQARRLIPRAKFVRLFDEEAA